MVPSVEEGKIVLIANPVSKSGRGAVAASEAARLLRERVGQERFEMLTTAWAGHGESLARELGPDVGCVIALGGDGLVNEVVNGLMARIPEDRPVLAVIPVGSGNDYAETLGMAYSVPTAVTEILRFQTVRADVGRVLSLIHILASRILSYDFLWTEVRVKGGAYGAGFQTTRSGSSRFYSYRDPRIDETVERFRTAGDWLAGVFSPTESEMDGYVVSTVASLDAPAKARELLRRQDGLYFSGATLADRARMREEVRAARTEDVRALAPSVDAIAGAGCVCAFGNGEVIRASGEDFNVVDLLA